jgi:hypothetical protein
VRPLSDETWQALDPLAGRLSRRDRRRAVVAGVAVVALLVAGHLLAASGAVTARLAFGSQWSYGDGRETGTMYHSFMVVNEGGTPVEIVGVGRPGPGLEPVVFPTGVEDEVNRLGVLEPGQELRLGVAYRVTDCDAVPDEPWPVPVRIDRWWGTQTVWIELPTQSRTRFQLPPDRVDNGAVWWDEGVAWQRVLADAHCYYAAGGQPWAPDEPEE